MEVTMADMAEVWCRDSDGTYQLHSLNVDTRYSEFGCLYDVNKVLSVPPVSETLSQDCQAQLIRDLCKDPNYYC